MVLRAEGSGDVEDIGAVGNGAMVAGARTEDVRT